MTSLELSRRRTTTTKARYGDFNSQEMRFCGGVKSIPLISRLFNQDYKSTQKPSIERLKTRERETTKPEIHDLPEIIFNKDEFHKKNSCSNMNNGRRRMC